MLYSRRQPLSSPRSANAHQRAPNRAGSGKRLQAWERQAALDAYRNGEKLEAIAAEFGCSCAAVSAGEASWSAEEGY